MSLKHNRLRWGAYALILGPFIGALAALIGLVSPSWNSQPIAHISSLIGGIISIVGVGLLTTLPEWQGIGKLFAFIGAICVIIGAITLGAVYPITQLASIHYTSGDMLDSIFTLGEATLLVGSLALAFGTRKSGLFYGSMPWLLSIAASASAVMTLTTGIVGQILSTALTYAGLFALGIGFLIYVSEFVDMLPTREQQPD